MPSLCTALQSASEIECPFSKLLLRAFSPLTEHSSLQAESVYRISILCPGTTGLGGTWIQKKAQGYIATVMEAA